jgi:holo-[acyl-carrier protein] synthase
MIIGIGTDIVEIDRIREAYERHGEGLLKRICTPAEIAVVNDHRDPIPHLAGRWAAKEAVAKALGTGFGADCAWTDVEILRNPQGAPVVALHASGRETADKLGIKRVHVSISHERSMAVAFAICET